MKSICAPFCLALLAALAFQASTSTAQAQTRTLPDGQRQVWGGAHTGNTWVNDGSPTRSSPDYSAQNAARDAQVRQIQENYRAQNAREMENSRRQVREFNQRMDNLRQQGAAQQQAIQNSQRDMNQSINDNTVRAVQAIANSSNSGGSSYRSSGSSPDYVPTVNIYGNRPVEYVDEREIERANERAQEAEEERREAIREGEEKRREQAVTKAEDMLQLQQEQDDYWRRASNRIWNWGRKDPWGDLGRKIEQWENTGSKPNARPTVADTGEIMTWEERKQRDRDELSEKRGYSRQTPQPAR